MSDKSHVHVHRPATVAQYSRIQESAIEYLRAYQPVDTLPDFARKNGYSPRQVQRALSYFKTSWRALKKSNGRQLHG
jgi:hypothetical protein